MAADSFVSTIEHRGFAKVEGTLDDSEISDLLRAIERANDSESSLKMSGSIFAVRNLLNAIPEVAELADSQAVRRLIQPVLGDSYLVVRGILFDKVPGANWKVPWHQDVTIAVQSRVEAEGFGPWSTKAGVLHVQPPASVLEKMISVRFHLDPCTANNGALRVVPGSHTLGRIPEEAIPEVRERFGDEICELSRGGALLMRPLLLHASSPSLSPDHRRVIHLDFASATLPAGLRWETVPQLRN